VLAKIFSGWLLAPSASTFGSDIDHLYNVVLLLTAIVFVLTEAALITFCLRYRARPGQKASPSHGSNKAELIWTAIPACILVVLGIMSQNLWGKLRQPKNFPQDEMVVRVVAEQWLWHFKYQGPDGEVEVQNDFHIPVGKNVRFELTSQDVIHGFYIPDLRINQDAVPGLTSSVWVQAKRIGQYELRCTQFCGTNHYQMKGQLTVESPEEFQAWLKSAKAAAF
jgi:cytochrome c oxidase subunit 2